LRFGLTPHQLFVSLLYLARWLTYFGVYLYVINNVRRDEVASVWQTLTKVMLAFAGFGVFQSIFLPGFAQLVYPESGVFDWDAQGHRLVSTVLDPNLAASMITLVLLIQLAQLSVGARVKLWQPTLFLVALVLTLSRGAVVGLVSGLVVIVLVRGISTRMLKLFGSFLFVAIGVMPQLMRFAQTYARFEFGTGTSAGSRVVAWLLALEVIAKHPLIGVGFNTYGFIKESASPLIGASSYSSDGGLLFVTVMTGVVGLILYLLMLGSVITRCRRIWRNPVIAPETRGIALGATAGIVAVCIHSLFANSIFTTFVMEIMWIIWGLTFVISRRVEHEADEPRSTIASGILRAA
jgi:O-antigen ligase